MYNFGSPRVGNHAFASFYDRCVPNRFLSFLFVSLKSFRVVNDQDIVVSFPKLVYVFKHIGREIVIDKRGNLITDLSFVEKLFRGFLCVFLNLAGNNSLAEHTMDKYKEGLIACYQMNEHPADGWQTVSPIQSLKNLNVLSIGKGDDPKKLVDDGKEEESDSDDEIDETFPLLY